ncbi:Acriflavine resistance protein B [Serratia proteamaculans]|uniref:multidrug efflux RND transporter permease subunit n=1 Tax=Serratia proteamaculans TaxID=28151 RepID=UPI002177C54F|nr:multidrug efflux RND transporter permease subunit [Serratia proteamaculans]CAI1992550.1 Acriflavine resistance protein B [Serratia proteamaculans]
MPHFFINRPVFAWVIAIFIVLFGLISIPQIPVAQYPSVAPPSISISVDYPGSTPEIMNESVITLIERELSGIDGLLYFESSSDTSGVGTIRITFKPGTNIKLAQVDVQNHIKVVEPRLPQTVRKNGLQVDAASSGFLMIVGLSSPDDEFTAADLSDYFARNFTEELRRVNGVGKVQAFGAEKAMRIWLDPTKMVSYHLSVKDVTDAINNQNTQIAPGRIGDTPTVPGYSISYPLTVDSQLSTPDEFKKIILKASTDGAKVILSDIARVEVGSQTYSFASREDSHDSTAAGIQLSPGANAVKTANDVRQRFKELAKSLPDGVQYSISFDSSTYVKISIEKVIHTFIEAMLIVFLVMYLFLQNIRYTIIPAIVAPIALLGTFTIMLISGYSINILTMFGMVLAIGIIVDDAIVVVENVNRIMTEEGLSPKEATKKAMKEITGAVVGITLVLTAVFIPMGFFGGSVGIIYQQFTISMAISILFSAFLALTLTPALCATILKPVSTATYQRGRFFTWFNRSFDMLSSRYESGITYVVKKVGRMMVLYVGLCSALFLSYKNLPSSFLPVEDQGYFMTSIQLPPDATIERTKSVVEKFEKFVDKRSGVAGNTSIIGFNFSGIGTNAALAITKLKDWDKRDGATSQSEVDATQEAFSNIPEANIMSILPAPITELGNSSGFTMRLEDRAGYGYMKLVEAVNILLNASEDSRVVQGVYIDGLPDGVSATLQIDREKAEAMGVSFTDISETLTGTIGSLYVNDFPNSGRIQKVIIQADAPYRMQLDHVLSLNVRNKLGEMVPISEFVRAKWQQTPQQLIRYQGYPAFRLTGSAAQGYSSGDAMKEMEKLATKLPPGFVVEWTGQSLQEQQSSTQAPVLIALSIFIVFLVLAALYESWSIPLSVILVVPLGLLGTVAAVIFRDMSNDVFFKVGLITIIGLSAKNAILITEFAIQKHTAGESIIASTIKSAKMRLRPIMMTSLAFTLGVVPLMLATGASATIQHAIGTGVFGGMISGTLLAIFFVPVFFIFVMTLSKKIKALVFNKKT